MTEVELKRSIIDQIESIAEMLDSPLVSDHPKIKKPKRK